MLNGYRRQLDDNLGPKLEQFNDIINNMILNYNLKYKINIHPDINK